MPLSLSLSFTYSTLKPMSLSSSLHFLPLPLLINNAPQTLSYYWSLRYCFRHHRRQSMSLDSEGNQETHEQDWNRCLRLSWRLLPCSCHDVIRAKFHRQKDLKGRIKLIWNSREGRFNFPHQSSACRQYSLSRNCRNDLLVLDSASDLL